MGERIPATIKVGGKLRRADAEELIELLNAESLTVDSDQETKPDLVNLGETFGNYQVNYGNLDEITDFCNTHGLDYEHWYDSGGDWSATTCRRVGEAYEEMLCDSGGRHLIAIDELIKTDALATGWAELHDRIKFWALPFPKLEIIS